MTALTDNESTSVLWVMRSAISILLMQTGFALLEAGSVRVINAVNIMMKNIADMVLGFLIFFMIGYGLFNGGGNAFMGVNQFFLVDTPLEDYYYFFFHYSFAATAATIDSGAIAERFEFKSYLILSTVLTGVIYPIVAHWQWHEEGFLFKWGFYDFAGSNAVHFLGGISALVSCIKVGPRHIFKADQVGSFKLLNKNPVFQLYGTFLLGIGWLSFNCGSVVTPGNSRSELNSVGIVAVNTMIGASIATVVGMIWSLYRWDGKVQVGEIVNSFLAGLVTVTACANAIKPGDAYIISGLAPVIAFGIEELLLKYDIDDPVGAIPVHAGTGSYSIIVTGLFHNEFGLFYTGKFDFFGVQLAGLLITAIWTIILTYITLVILERLEGIRVPNHLQEIGLDACEHGSGDSTQAVINMGSMLLNQMNELMEGPKEGSKKLLKFMESMGFDTEVFAKKWKSFSRANSIVGDTDIPVIDSDEEHETPQKNMNVNKYVVNGHSAENVV